MKTDTRMRVAEERRLYPTWPADVGSGFLGGVLASLIVIGLLAWQSTWVAEKTLSANPTCSAPRGLRAADVVSAEGASHESQWAATKSIDHASQTLWIPPVLNADAHGAEISRQPKFDMEAGANVLTLRLDGPADVRLVCVVNGAALWYTSYQNWGRVRTVEVWGEDETDRKLGHLESLGSEDFPNSQVAARSIGRTAVIHIAVLDSYAGQRVEVFNPTSCLEGATMVRNGQEIDARDEFMSRLPTRLARGIHHRYQDGCILEPKVRAGLAEVDVYVED